MHPACQAHISVHARHDIPPRLIQAGPAVRGAGDESHAGQVFCCVAALAIAGALDLLDRDLLCWWCGGAALTLAEPHALLLLNASRVPMHSAALTLAMCSCTWMDNVSMHLAAPTLAEPHVAPASDCIMCPFIRLR